jgi:hypothetical protein
MVWRCLENRRIPPSAASSPDTPKITSILNIFTYYFPFSDSAYSPMSPTTQLLGLIAQENGRDSEEYTVADCEVQFKEMLRHKRLAEG